MLGTSDRGQGRPPAGPSHARPAPSGGATNPGAAIGLSGRARRHPTIRRRVHRRRHRRPRRVADRRRLARHAAGTTPVPGRVSHRGLPARQRRMAIRPPLPARAHPRQQPARVRLLPHPHRRRRRRAARRAIVLTINGDRIGDHPVPRQRTLPPLRASPRVARSLDARAPYVVTADSRRAARRGRAPGVTIEVPPAVSSFRQPRVIIPHRHPHPSQRADRGRQVDDRETARRRPPARALSGDRLSPRSSRTVVRTRGVQADRPRSRIRPRTPAPEPRP